MMKSSFITTLCCSLMLLIIILSNCADAGVTSRFVRKLEESQDMPLNSDVFRVPSGYNAPQQVRLIQVITKRLDYTLTRKYVAILKVHITQGDYEGKAMIVSWVTMDEPGSSIVTYWTATRKRAARGIYTRYKFYTYKSGYIHHCTLTNLKVLCISLGTNLLFSVCDAIAPY